MMMFGPFEPMLAVGRNWCVSRFSLPEVLLLFGKLSGRKALEWAR